MPVRRFASYTRDDGTTRMIAAMPQWAGESVSWGTGIQSAAEIVREKAGETERLPRRRGSPERRPTSA